MIDSCCITELLVNWSKEQDPAAFEQNREGVQKQTLPQIGKAQIVLTVTVNYMSSVSVNNT